MCIRTPLPRLLDKEYFLEAFQGKTVHSPTLQVTHLYSLELL